MTPKWIWGVNGDTCYLKRLRVVYTRVATTVSNYDGVFPAYRIKVYTVQRTSLFLLCIVVHVADNPFTGRGVGCSFIQSILDTSNTSEVSVHILECVQARVRRMGMSVNKSRQNRHSSSINHLGIHGLEVLDVFV